MSEDGTGSILAGVGAQAREAAAALRIATTAQKNAALLAAADALTANRNEILAANKRDLENANANGVSGAMLDRLKLEGARFDGVAKAIRDVAALPDPVGETIESWERPNGLAIERVRTPIGVIAIIYESRPNVTTDAAALCVKSGNAAILRGGSEAFETSMALHRCFVAGLAKAGLPESAVQFVQTTDRAAVGEILAGLNGAIDLIIPRGGKSLVARVQREARAPVLGHLEGVCHVYVDGGADMEKAAKIVTNAKMRRTGICGAAETVLIDRACLQTHWPAIAESLREAGCEIRADEDICKIDSDVKPATDEDFHTEYLDAIISAAVVDGAEGAAAHIAGYGTGHTDSIITEDDRAARYFLDHVDSAIVMLNASTQFADGGEFGLGAEIGIATGRLHARGPVGVRELTTYKNVVRGTGQTRP